MDAPNKIYVLPKRASVVKASDDEVEYIRKDEVIALLEIKARGAVNITRRCALEGAIEIINSL